MRHVGLFSDKIRFKWVFIKILRIEFAGYSGNVERIADWNRLDCRSKNKIRV